MTGTSPRIAIVSHRDRQAREPVPPEKGRFARVFEAFTALGASPQSIPYHDDCRGEARGALMAFDGVLVWVNPEEGGRDRTQLDAMLREVAAAGVFVSAHPDAILALGTKEVLYRTRALGWGCDTHLHRSMAELRRELPPRLGRGEARVLKQYRGHGGDGVWKVELAAPPGASAAKAPDDVPAADLRVRVRHAKHGSREEEIALDAFFSRCAPYFDGEGRIVDQAWQPRLPEGMIRCYLVGDTVGGFGHQAINALCPAPAGAPRDAVPAPTPRLYYAATLPRFQALRRKLEAEWVPQMLQVLGMRASELPVLWDCDFLLGPKTDAGEDSYVLCEINASSVSPFPDSAAPLVARATLDAIGGRRTR